VAEGDSKGIPQLEGGVPLGDFHCVPDIFGANAGGSQNPDLVASRQLEIIVEKEPNRGYPDFLLVNHHGRVLHARRDGNRFDHAFDQHRLRHVERSARAQGGRACGVATVASRPLRKHQTRNGQYQSNESPDHCLSPLQ